MSRTDGDELLLRRAARRLGGQAAALVVLAMLLLVALVTVAVVHGQDTATATLLATTAGNADDVGDPPPGTWIVLAEGAQLTGSPGLPRALAAPLGVLRDRDPGGPGGPPVVRTVRAGVTDYRVLTQRQGGRTLQVVTDLTGQRQERGRLLRAMALAAALSLLVAGALGLLLGRRAVRPLARALALQRTFVADASHELRTPLTLLSTRAQLLDRALQSSPGPAELRVDSRGVLADVQRLVEVVEDLLIAADPGRDEQHRPVDLEALLIEVQASAAAHAGAAGVSLVVAAATAAGPWSVPGSAVALRRAVLALVDNAIDHTPAGGQVRLALRPHRRTLVVAVQDSGPGIADADADRVLRRFHSGGHRAGRAHYGLGLALSQDVAHRHRGQLRLAPAPTGTTFELVLPRRR